MNKLKTINWWTVFQGASSAGQACTSFHEALYGALDSTLPIKKIEMQKSKGTKYKFSPEIKQRRNELDALATIAVSTKDPVHYDRYIAYKSMYKRIIDETVRKSYLNQIQIAENKQKQIWDIINKNSKVGSQHNAAASITAQSLNDHFITSVPPPTAVTNINGQLNKMKIDNCGSIYMRPVTCEELSSIVVQIKSKQTQDAYGMSTQLLKSILAQVLEPLVYVINSCMSEGIFPEEWKISKVVPIPKKGDISDAKNYRPISILPAISKAFEKVIVNRIVYFFEKNKFFNGAQHGYRKGKSTTTSVLEVVEEIVKAIDNRQEVNLTCYDLSKAFDTVSHDILLDKLYYYGIRGAAHKLMRSYLHNRKQYVAFNSQTSTVELIKQGVPQGSMLGPLLFVIYVNDLPYGISTGNIYLYADDTSLLTTGRTEKELRENLKNAADVMKDWFSDNHLSLNENKTQDLTFKIRGGNKNHSVEFLGLRIDELLNWSYHVDATARKLTAAIYSIRRIKQISTQHATLLTYYANFHSVASYGILLWGMSTEANRIFRLQKKAIRILAGLKQRETCRIVFKELKILTIPSVYILTTLMYVHQNKHKYLENGQLHTYDTRHRMDLQVPLHRTKTTQKYIDYWGTHLYNKVPANIKSFNEKKFKVTIKKLLTQSVCYSVDEFISTDWL